MRRNANCPICKKMVLHIPMISRTLVPETREYTISGDSKLAWTKYPAFLCADCYAAWREENKARINKTIDK